MNFLVRFADYTDDTDDSKKVSVKWGDMDSAVDDFLDRYWYDNDSPEAPFDVAVCEANDTWNPVGKEKIFRISNIDYSPNFYYDEVEDEEEGREQDSSSTLSNDSVKIPTPTTTEQKTNS